MKKPARKSIQKVGLATSDWSLSIVDARGWQIPGGANWIRFGQVAGGMRNHLVSGVLRELNSGLAVQTFDNAIHKVPIIVMQRLMDDWVLEAMPKAQNDGIVIINDIDDLFWGIHPDNSAKKVVDPNHNKSSNFDIYKKVLASSDLVTVSTPYLLSEVQKLNSNVLLVENGVSSHLFSRKKHRKVAPTVGWVGSTAHRSNDLEILADPFGRLPRNWKFHHTGHLDSHPSFAKKTGISPSRLTVTPMLPPLEYPLGFRDFDIGVVPLNDIPFNRAKSWIKGLEYAAAGIPFIASRSDEYVRLNEQYGVGRLAGSSEEWLQHFDELSDYRIREKESIANRQVIEKHFSVSQMMSKPWDEIIWSFCDEV